MAREAPRQLGALLSAVFQQRRPAPALRLDAVEAAVIGVEIGQPGRLVIVVLKPGVFGDEAFDLAADFGVDYDFGHDFVP